MYLLWLWGTDRNFCLRGHYLASPGSAMWCQTVIPKDGYLCPYRTVKIDTFSCIPLFSYLFIYLRAQCEYIIQTDMVLMFPLIALTHRVIASCLCGRAFMLIHIPALVRVVSMSERDHLYHFSAAYIWNISPFRQWTYFIAIFIHTRLIYSPLLDTIMACRSNVLKRFLWLDRPCSSASVKIEHWFSIENGIGCACERDAEI